MGLSYPAVPVLSPAGPVDGTGPGPVRGGTRRGHGDQQGRHRPLEHPAGQTEGKAVEKKTKEFTLDGQKFNASDDEPYWVVESSKSGKQAAHKESSLS